MKACSYCGKQNPDDSQFCLGCANELPQQETRSADDPEPSTPENDFVAPEIAAFRRSSLLSAGYFEKAAPVDISAFDMGYAFEEGFSHPDWKKIRTGISQTFPKERWPQVWREVGIKWLAQLKGDLGGDYRQYESWNFLLLSAETAKESEGMLRIAEEALNAIERHLEFLVDRREKYGKRVILVFNEEDDYYSYISHFYTEGNHAASGGVFIRGGGYGHVALPFPGGVLAARILVHELTHDCLRHFKLPSWLNEGLSRRLEREVGRMIVSRGTQAHDVVLSRELAREHHAYWNETNIQQFWAGTSFYQPDDGNRLSYSLGEIMVELLAEGWKDFLVFVENADRKDGGQDAALKCLGCCLGNTVARFLGPGEWRPNRKAIADLWKAREEMKEDSGDTLK